MEIFMKFGNKSFTLFDNTHFVGPNILFDGLYKFNLHDEFPETLPNFHCSIGTNCNIMNKR